MCVVSYERIFSYKYAICNPGICGKCVVVLDVDVKKNYTACGPCVVGVVTAWLAKKVLTLDHLKKICKWRKDARCSVADLELGLKNTGCLLTKAPLGHGEKGRVDYSPGMGILKKLSNTNVIIVGAEMHIPDGKTGKVSNVHHYLALNHVCIDEEGLMIFGAYDPMKPGVVTSVGFENDSGKLTLEYGQLNMPGKKWVRVLLEVSKK